MTTLKLDPKLGPAAAAAIDPHTQAIYDRPGCTRLAIVEFRHIERTQPTPEAGKDPSVRVRIARLEIPTPDQEDLVRDAMNALHLQRTATGTVDAAGQVHLATATLRRLGDRVAEVEVARLRAGLAHWADHAAKTAAQTGLSADEVRGELGAIATGLRALLDHTSEDQ